jgi:inosine-uridine nucleoside N-ribohydrolase
MYNLAMEIRENVIVVDDPARDPDGDQLLATLATLHHEKQINLNGFLTTLYPSQKRAQFVTGALALLGLNDTKVVAGADGNYSTEIEYEFQGERAEVMEPLKEQTTSILGEEILKNWLSNSEVHSTTLLVTAMTTDVAGLTMLNPDSTARAIRKIVFMMGATEQGGILLPDTSNNWTFDNKASLRVALLTQALEIPAIFVSRHAIPTISFAELENVVTRANETNSPASILARIALDTQIKGFTGLWDRAQMPHYKADGSVNTNRHGLPERCDINWFTKVFLNSYQPSKGENVYELAKQMGQGAKLYDPTAALCASDELLERFFDPHILKIGNTEYKIVGRNEKETNLKDIEGLKSYLLDALYKAWSR